MPSTNHLTKFAARVLLVLAVLQFVFVAFETAGMVHATEDGRIHHEQVLIDGMVETDQSDLSHTSDPPLDICDHCCHCHGHGAHFSLLPHYLFSLVGPTPAHHFPHVQQFQSRFIDSIHRPPIA